MYVEVDGVDKSTKDLAVELGVTTRMINIYRAAAEEKLKRSIGARRGKVVWFSPEEQDLIRQMKTRGVQAEEVSKHYQQRNQADFSHSNAECESSMLTNIGAIAEQNDQQAIQLGQQLGSRFVNITYASMMQTMSLGLAQIGAELGEMNASLTVSLPAIDSQVLVGQSDSLMLEGDVE